MTQNCRVPVRRDRWLAAAIGLMAVVVASSAWAGTVSLDYRPDFQTVGVGDVVNVGLYALSDDETTQPVSAIDLVFAWDPDYLQLLGLDDTGAVDLLMSGFPAGDSYGINELVPPQDGDGYYLAFAPLAADIMATPEGALITTFQFEALDLTPETVVDILVSGGVDPEYQLETTVWDGIENNHPITGILGGAAVEIIPEPGSLSLLAIGCLAVVAARRRR